MVEIKVTADRKLLVNYHLGNIFTSTSYSSGSSRVSGTSAAIGISGASGSYGVSVSPSHYNTSSTGLSINNVKILTGMWSGGTSWSFPKIHEYVFLYQSGTFTLLNSKL